MKVVFENLNNNDTEHEIVFLSITKYESDHEQIRVLFDGGEYIGNVYFDSKGHRYFRYAGKTYDFEILKGGVL